jgi:HEAT repeat protein
VRESAAAAFAGMGPGRGERYMRGDAVADSLRFMAGRRLAELVKSDSSRYVRGAALVAHATISSGDPLPVIEPVLSRDSWLDMERAQAVRALALVDTPLSWTWTLRFLAASTSRPTRQAAIASLLARATGREAELATAFRPLLDADDLFIRVSAARALGSLSETSSIQALEARLAVEAESRVINAIRGALDALRSGR